MIITKIGKVAKITIITTKTAILEPVPTKSTPIKEILEAIHLTKTTQGLTSARVETTTTTTVAVLIIRMSH